MCNRGTLGVNAARPRARLPILSLSTDSRLHTLSYPMSTSGVFQPLWKRSAQTYAPLSEGVALRWQPVHRRWDEPLLAKQPVHRHFFENCVCTIKHDGVWAAGPPALLHVRSLSTVLRYMLHWWRHVCCTHATFRSKGHATKLRNWLPQPARCLHSSTYGDHNRPAPACHAPWVSQAAVRTQ